MQSCVKEILFRAYWTKEHKFKKFYDKDIINKEFQEFKYDSRLISQLHERYIEIRLQKWSFCIEFNMFWKYSFHYTTIIPLHYITPEEGTF